MKNNDILQTQRTAAESAEETMPDHLFPPEPEMTPEQAEENLRRITQAAEAVQGEREADQQREE